VLTITDGKIRNAITSMSPAQVCYVHGVAPKQIDHNLKLLKYIITLHVWITFICSLWFIYPCSDRVFLLSLNCKLASSAQLLPIVIRLNPTGVRTFLLLTFVNMMDRLFFVCIVIICYNLHILMCWIFWD
jgi:hypothetical protein